MGTGFITAHTYSYAIPWQVLRSYLSLPRRCHDSSKTVPRHRLFASTRSPNMALLKIISLLALIAPAAAFAPPASAVVASSAMRTTGAVTMFGGSSKSAPKKVRYQTGSRCAVRWVINHVLTMLFFCVSQVAKKPVKKAAPKKAAPKKAAPKKAAPKKVV